MSQASFKYPALLRLEGLYMHITISLSAIALILFFISSHGVIQSLKLITAKSCDKGAPRQAAPLLAAVTPDITLISVSSSASSYTRLAMPYTPLSPLHTSTTFLPSFAISMAYWQRSFSCIILVE